MELNWNEALDRLLPVLTLILGILLTNYHNKKQYERQRLDDKERWERENREEKRIWKRDKIVDTIKNVMSKFYELNINHLSDAEKCLEWNSQLDNHISSLNIFLGSDIGTEIYHYSTKIIEISGLYIQENGGEHLLSEFTKIRNEVITILERQLKINIEEFRQN